MFRMSLQYWPARIVLLTACVLLFGFVVPSVSANPPAQGSDMTLTADQTNLTQGQCTTLHESIPEGWSLVQPLGMMWQANGCSGAAIQDSLEVCPTTTTTYTIYANYCDGTKQASITITVSALPPPSPSPQVPTNTDIPPTPIPPTLIPTKAPTIAPTITLTLPALNPVPTPFRTGTSPTPVQAPLVTATLPIKVYPDYKQNTGVWSSDLYDHNTSSSDTIARWGCAMTSIANLLSYYGARNIDPGKLNTWMNQHSGYDSHGWVNWASVNSYIPLGSKAPVMKWVTSIVRQNRNFQSAINKSLSNNWPVILQYYVTTQYYTGTHYIVATDAVDASPGKSEYIIWDPYDSPNKITQLTVDDPNIQQAFFYQPADGNISASLTIKAHSPISYVLIDEQGHRLGYEPKSDQQYWEITDGNYAYNPPGLNSC